MLRRNLAKPWRALAIAARRIPSQCAVCGSWPAQRLCNACIARLAQPRARCRGCALPLFGGAALCGICLRAPPPLDACIAAVDYAYPWAGVLSEFKFDGDPGWAASIAGLLRSTPWAQPTIDAADALLAIPLTRERLAERGFNQSQWLARALSSKKTVDGLLLRVGSARDQHALKRSERLANLNTAFAVDPLRISELQGKRLVLVDDVMTTGATLHAAARTLRKAGAATVSALVFARTDLR